MRFNEGRRAWFGSRLSQAFTILALFAFLVGFLLWGQHDHSHEPHVNISDVHMWLMQLQYREFS